jgi:succinate dehydrogenase hydrophobic anchor subunit
MNARSGLLVALLAAGFVYHPGSSGSSPQPKKPSQARASSGGTVTYGDKLEIEDWPRETMHQFFSTRTVAKQEAAETVCPLGKGFQVDFLIATVADPANSHYQYAFDRSLEAIMLALGDSGYTLDRFWFPWESGGDADNSADDWVKREQHADWQSRKQDYPGILVLRGSEKKVLAVLLVGENPVNGINKQEFDNALDLMAHFKGDVGEVKVVGPTFSGSIPTLGMAMRDSMDGAPKNRAISGYQAITGSATAQNNKKTLEAYGNRIHYSATIENDSVALSGFLKYLKSQGRSDRVAFLTESGSDYASQFVEAKANLGKHGPLVLQYPMEISRLRNAYEDDSELSALSTSSAPSAPRQGLQITLKDSHQAADSIPAFSPDLSPVAQEATLLDTLAIISRQRIEYAGIIATDILDAIFLGRMLKQHCPDVRLVIFNSDLVYAGIAQNRAFQGMLAVTTYPLSPANQLWTGSWDTSRPLNVFSSDATEGTYNACKRLLSGDKPHAPLAEYAPPEWERPSDFDTKVPTGPSLWLTAVGRDAIWPLQTLPIEGVSSTTPVIQPLSTKTISRLAPKGWTIGFYLFTLLCGLLAAEIWWRNRRPDDGKSVERGFLALWQVTDGSRSQAKVSVTAAACATLVAYGFIAAVQIRYLALNHLFDSSVTVPGGSLLSWSQAAMCVVAPTLLLAAMAWCWRPPMRWWIGIAPACVAASALFSLWMYFDSLTLPYVYRCVNAGNGVSPVAPMLFLLAVLFWYACAQLNRISLCRAKPAGLPSFAGDVYLGGAVGSHDDPKAPPAGDISKALPAGSLRRACADMSLALDRWWFGRWSWRALAVCGIAVLLVPLTSTRIGSLEGPAFGQFYTVGLFAVFLALLFSCARFVHAWLGLRTILHMVEAHPICRAFERLGQEKGLSPSLVWRWGGGRQTEITLAQSIDRLRALTEERMSHRLDDWSGADYERNLETLEKNARQVIAADSCGHPVEREALDAINATLLDVSEHLVNHVLAPARWKGARETQRVGAAAGAGSASGLGSGGAISLAPLSSIDTDAAEDFVALRFVAVIRYVTMHLKNLLEFVAAGLMLAIVSLVCYPFEPHHLIMTAISTCFFIIGGVFLFAFVQMSRNKIISDLSGSTGKLDGNLLHLVSFGALPLVTVLSAQFPSIGGFLFSWVKPALETMK